jgi:hypothetical protein
MLSICLVISRHQFLPQALFSLGQCLEDERVNLVLLENGHNFSVSQSLDEWNLINHPRVTRLKIEMNELTPNLLWSKLRTMDLGWVCFPGDDDVMYPQGLNKVLELIERSDQYVAITCDVREIDSSGRSIGYRRPVYQSGLDQLNTLAHAFHQPPFIWPSLFFRFDLVKDLPHPSRYTFDWWLSLHLLVKGKSFYFNEVVLNYRIHEGQESNRQPLLRKNFEGFIMIKEFLSSDSFLQLISEADIESVSNFWLSLLTTPPLYQDQVYSFALLNIILEKLKLLKGPTNDLNDFFLDFALYQGILLQPLESGIASATSLEKSPRRANFRLEFHPKCCLQHFGVADLEPTTRRPVLIKVSCLHSPYVDDFITVDCGRDPISLNSFTDEIARLYVEQLEKSSKVFMRTTPLENQVIRFLRMLKLFIPRSLLRIAKRSIGLISIFQKK